MFSSIGDRSIGLVTPWRRNRVSLERHGCHIIRPPTLPPHSPTLRYIAFMERGLRYEVHGTSARVLARPRNWQKSLLWDPVFGRLAARRTMITVDLPSCGHMPTYNDPAPVAEVTLGGRNPRSGCRFP